MSGLLFFGDSLTDEGRAGQTAPVMWPSVLRHDISVFAGANFAIGGATTGHQPSARFGDSSFLGQVGSFIASGTPVAARTTAVIWVGTNNIWMSSSQGQASSAVADLAAADVTTGIAQLVAAGVHDIILLGVYDLSQTNAFGYVNADTPAVRQNAAEASQRYNAQLAALTLPGATLHYVDIAAFIAHLQADPQAYGFQTILPLRPGAACDALCQRTSIFDDTIHLSSKTQELIGDYVATGDPVFNRTAVAYGARAIEAAGSQAPASMSARLWRAAKRFWSRLF